MKFGLALMTVLLLGCYLYYGQRGDGFTARQVVTSANPQREILVEHDTTLGRVLLTRIARANDDHTGLVVDAYFYHYFVVKRRVLPLFWYGESAGSCSPESKRTVLKNLAYHAERYKHPPQSSNTITLKGSVVCGYVKSPAVERVLVTFSDGSRLESLIQAETFFIAHSESVPACTIEVLAQDGTMLESQPIIYVFNQDDWQGIQGCN